MAKGKKDYKITKTEKGPLQRFKNQNLILKKYGEVGLKIYRAITGKRTVKELQKDLGIEKEIFDSIIDYMQEAGMVELVPAVAEEKPKKVPEEEVPPEEEVEEIPPEEAEEEITPAEEEVEIEKPEIEAEEEEEEYEEEIKPIGIEPVEEEEAPPEEEVPEEEEEVPEEEEAPEEEYELGEIEAEEAEEEEGEELTPIEKIVKDKYGDIGLQVYNLIDGQKTAEEIMKETGLGESKLIEILDFMDDQGIIKLDYPKGKEKEVEKPTPKERKEAAEAFGPMVGEEAVPGMVTIPSPVEIPVKAPMDIVKSVQMKAKILLKYKEGGKVFEEMDGKKDVIDIALKLDIPLYRLYDIINFMLENEMIIMKPITRDAVKKKYGDDGYTVYKRYGREGLMLYELIGKELTIKEMADKVTTDRAKIIDMFLFIHEVLGIELPIDRDVLARQLGL
jgi:hypothetical protein